MTAEEIMRKIQELEQKYPNDVIQLVAYRVEVVDGEESWEISDSTTIKMSRVTEVRTTEK